MPLVDYASSDEESENELEVSEKKEVIGSEKNLVECSVESTEVSENLNVVNNDELFSSLPKPRKNFSFFEDDNKLSKLLLNKDSLPLGKKESVKIYVPSVSEFENNSQEPPLKKVKPSLKGAGLFSVLPPPKNTSVKLTNLVPQAVSKTQFKKNINKGEILTKNASKTSVKETGGDEDDDDDEETTVGSSFFGNSLVEQNDKLDSDYTSSDNTLIEETSDNIVVPGISLINDINIPEQNSNLDVTAKVDKDNGSYNIEHLNASEIVSASDNPLELDEKALQILCGNKKKRQKMPMNIIDLSSKEVLPDSKEWLLKQFTEEKRGRSHSHKKNQGPSSQSRRKHQITYLAYQAKEQELELQNQWANNRMSRKQTQSKYGF